MRWTTLGFIATQRQTQPPVLKADLTGKTVVVVGANTGLGFEATKHFATMNPGRLILACRNQTKGEAAVTRIASETSYSKAEHWVIDLSNFENVKQFATRFEEDGGRLDILVMNAGIADFVYAQTTDGWEATIQVNDLATSLVSLLLLPRMIQTANKHSTTPRLVIVSSEVHHWVNIEQEVIDSPNMFKTLGSKEYCIAGTMKNRYALSKLLNVFFVRALSSRLPATPSTTVITNAINPAYCYSELRRSWNGVRGFLDYLMEKALALTAEEGSRQLIYGALAEDKDGQMRGAYITAANVAEPSDFVISEVGEKVQERLWHELIEILSEVDPRVQRVVAEYLNTPVA